MQRLISSIYNKGYESRAHYKREGSDRSTNWANVPKNKRGVHKCKTRSINAAQHEYEMKHGFAPIANVLDVLLGGSK